MPSNRIMFGSEWCFEYQVESRAMNVQSCEDVRLEQS